jgi:hypothetical protein
MPDFVPMIFVFVVVLTLITSVTKIIIKAIDKRGSGTPRSLATVEERLARIEQAVDSIAIEMERVSEGQRFTTKLLSERAGSSIR